MSFRSHSTSRKTTAAATQKRQRAPGTCAVMTWSPRLQSPLIGILGELQARLGQRALQLVLGAEIFEMQIGAIRFERAHGDALDRRDRPQALAYLHPVAELADRHDDIEAGLRIAAHHGDIAPILVDLGVDLLGGVDEPVPLGARAPADPPP